MYALITAFDEFFDCNKWCFIPASDLSNTCFKRLIIFVFSFIVVVLKAVCRDKQSDTTVLGS